SPKARRNLPIICGYVRATRCSAHNRASPWSAAAEGALPRPERGVPLPASYGTATTTCRTGFAPVITGLPIKDVFMQRRVAALTIEDYAAGVRAGDRAMLARAITLVESPKPEHATLAQRLLQALLPSPGEALRLGVTGVPGVGKSTTIDQLGMNLIAAGHRVAVLAVDPTSKRT